MSKVLMVAGISGTRDGVDWPAVGEVLECSKDEAEQLVAAGLAKSIEKNAAPVEAEKATARKPEIRKGLTTKDV